MRLGWIGLLALALAACGAAAVTPEVNLELPLAADRPTFLWFFTEP